MRAHHNDSTGDGLSDDAALDAMIGTMLGAARSPTEKAVWARIRDAVALQRQFRSFLDRHRYWTNARDEFGEPMPLPAVCAQLSNEVCELVDSDPAAKAERLSWPHEQVMGALHDLVLGGRPALFEYSDPDQPRRTKPTGLTRDLVRAKFVSAVNTLVKGGMKPGIAAQWVATLASRLRLRFRPNDGGKDSLEMVAGLILELRSRVARRPANASDNQKELIEADRLLLQLHPELTATPEAAKATARSYLEVGRDLSLYAGERHKTANTPENMRENFSHRPAGSRRTK